MSPYFSYFELLLFAALSWSNGSYRLPQPLSGCPKSWASETFLAFKGNSKTPLHHSKNTHLQKNITTSLVLKLCRSPEKERMLKGDYCIFAGGSESECPSGFHAGSISWNSSYIDFSNERSKTNRHCNETLSWCTVKTCCRKDGENETSLHLQLGTNFYLMLVSDSCQSVSGAEVGKEFVEFTFESSSDGRFNGSVPYNMDKFPRKLYLCYYTQNKSETTATLTSGPSKTVQTSSRKTLTLFSTSASPVQTTSSPLTSSGMTTLPQVTASTILQTIVGSSRTQGSPSAQHSLHSSVSSTARMPVSLSVTTARQSSSPSLLSTVSYIKSLGPSISVTPATNRTHGHRTGKQAGSRAAVIGAVVGCVGGVFLIVIIACWCWRRRKARMEGYEQIPLWTFLTRGFSWLSEKDPDFCETSFVSVNACDPLLGDDGI